MISYSELISDAAFRYGIDAAPLRYAWDGAKHPRGKPKNKGQFAKGKGTSSSAAQPGKPATKAGKPTTKAPAKPAKEVAKKPARQTAADKRKSRTVDRAGLMAKLEPHAGHVLSPDEVKKAKKQFDGLSRNHKDLVHHRIEELANATHEAFQQAADDNAKNVLGKQMRVYSEMIAWGDAKAKKDKADADARPYGEKVSEKAAKAAPYSKAVKEKAKKKKPGAYASQVAEPEPARGPYAEQVKAESEPEQSYADQVTAQAGTPPQEASPKDSSYAAWVQQAMEKKGDYPSFAKDDPGLLEKAAPKELEAWRDAYKKRQGMSPEERQKFSPTISKAHDALKEALRKAKLNVPTVDAKATDEQESPPPAAPSPAPIVSYAEQVKRIKTPGELKADQKAFSSAFDKMMAENNPKPTVTPPAKPDRKPGSYAAQIAASRNTKGEAVPRKIDPSTKGAFRVGQGTRRAGIYNTGDAIKGGKQAKPKTPPAVAKPTLKLPPQKPYDTLEAKIKAEADQQMIDNKKKMDGELTDSEPAVKKAMESYAGIVAKKKSKANQMSTSAAVDRLNKLKEYADTIGKNPNASIKEFADIESELASLTSSLTMPELAKVADAFDVVLTTRNKEQSKKEIRRKVMERKLVNDATNY